MTGPRRLAASWCAACLFFGAVPLYAAQSFVYVTRSSCEIGPPCTVLSVDAYDAATGRLAARIPLPPDRFAGRMALSPDGRRLYVSLTTVHFDLEIAVIDTTRHVLLGSHAVVGTGTLTFEEGLAVSRDGARVFQSSGSVIRGYNATSFAVEITIAGAARVLDLAASPVADRLYSVEGCDLAGCSIDPAAPAGTDSSELGEYDALTGARAATTRPRTGELWVDVHVSRDGSRVYATGSNQDVHDAGVSVFNPAGLTLLGRRSVGTFAFQTVDSISRERSYTTGFSPGMPIVAVLDFSQSPVGVVDVGPAAGIAVSADETRVWMADISTTSFFFPQPPGLPNELRGIDAQTNTVVTTTRLPGRPTSIVATPPNANICGYQVDTKQSSWMRDGGSATIVLRTPCAWSAASDAPWVHLGAAEGSGDATLTLTVDPNPTTTTRTTTLSIGGRLVTVTQAGAFSQPAFGFVDTPADNTSGVSGALILGGWALDDVGVTRVRIFRDPVAGEPDAPIFIGNATFVDGARPDVAAVFPAFPGASRAGWGLQILTNGLPGGGNGTYRLLVFAEDTEGHSTLLGTRTFTAANATATIPFGNIDTPSAGQTVSGTIINFGWALTPPPAFIPSGSTIDVLVDGVVVGHPTYGFARSDIDTSFPGFMNSGAAVGYFILDTRTLTNGLHTIAWVVHDNLGGTQGIGSRVFFVDNP